jgi:hypothetical protein
LSDLKVDGIIASTGTNTALTLQGKGSGKVAIGDGALLFPDADGTAGHFIKTDGSKALSFAAAGGLVLIGTDTVSGAADLTVTGIDATYDSYLLIGQNITPAADDKELYLRLGDSSGVDSGASDYAWTNHGLVANNVTTLDTYDAADAQINLTGSGSNEMLGSVVSGEGGGFWAYLNSPRGAVFPMVVGQCSFSSANAAVAATRSFSGHRLSLITTDRVSVVVESGGNMDNGRLTVWGVAHA